MDGKQLAVLSVPRNTTEHCTQNTENSPLPTLRGLHLLYGHAAAREAGFYMAAEWLCQRQTPHPTSHIRPPTLIVVDGENSFDPFIFSNAARRVGLLPDSILHNLFVSRAFTCHQLQALIVERLIPELCKTGSRMILVLGLLTTFYDEQVPMWEAQRLLRPTLGRLMGLAKHGYSILILLPGEPRRIPKRRSFLQWTKDCADRVFRIEESVFSVRGSEPGSKSDSTGMEYSVKVHLEKPMDEASEWEMTFDPAVQPRQ